MKLRYTYLLLLSLTITLSGCKRTLEKLPNTEPDTIITPESINLAGEDRLNSVVFLSWFGTDGDGYITGYEISLDNINWVYTTQNDSTFSFTLEAGSDTTDIHFYVRSIDNEGIIDPTPAYLKVPLKNTAPVATFVEKGFPADSVHIVTTFTWNATDVDGDETITKAFLKANQGDWLEIDINESMISLVSKTPSTLGVSDADLFYGTNQTPISEPLTGLNVGGDNTFYIKVIDFANAESEPDTSETVFVKAQTSSTLLVSGLPDIPTNVYKSVINPTLANYDFADYYLDGGLYQPGYWSPTFDLILSHYNTLIFVSDESSFTNSVNGRKDILLEFAAPSIQTFSNNGGKTLVITSFAKGQDLTGITSTLPIDSLSSAVGQARLVPDSTISSTLGAGFPDLQPTNIISGVSPFYMSTDAEEVYFGHLVEQGGWTGPSTVGARRIADGNIYQYFFTIQLYKLDQQLSDLQVLFDQILNNDFNW